MNIFLLTFQRVVYNYHQSNPHKPERRNVYYANNVKILLAQNKSIYPLS